MLARRRRSRWPIAYDHRRADPEAARLRRWRWRSLALHLILIVVALRDALHRRRARHLRRAEIRALRHRAAQRPRLSTTSSGRSSSRSSWIGLNIDRSRIGRALKAIAASETAAGSVGIDIVRYKVQMFVLAAGMASVCGSLGRALPARHGSERLRLRLQPELHHRRHHRRPDVDLGRRRSARRSIIGLRELLRGLSLPLWEGVIMGALTVVVLIAFRARHRRLHRAPVRPLDRRRAPRQARGVVAPRPAAPSPRVRPAPPARRSWRSSGASALLRQPARGRASVSFTVQPGSITALIGPNGAGKTTLFNLIGGYQPLDCRQRDASAAGASRRCCRTRSRALGIGRTFQNLQLFDNMTVLENVMCGHHRSASCRREQRRIARGARAAAARFRRPSRTRETPLAAARWPSAISAWSRSRAHSRSSRACCSWTSPPRA